MGHYPIDNSDVPIRLFKSDFLEFFSHISPIAVIIIWSPVIIFFFYRSLLVRPAGGSLWHIPAGFLIGLFLWTLAEYTLHRFVFHFPAKSPRGQRITFLFHGIHHAQPQCKNAPGDAPRSGDSPGSHFFRAVLPGHSRLHARALLDQPFIFSFPDRLFDLRPRPLRPTPPADA